MDSVQIRGDGTTTQLLFSPVLDISRARDLYEHLNQALSVGAPLTLDGSQITRIDTAALQVLTLFCRTAAERGIPVHWSSASASLREAVKVLGVDEYLRVRT